MPPETAPLYTGHICAISTLINVIILSISLILAKQFHQSNDSSESTFIYINKYKTLNLKDPWVFVALVSFYIGCVSGILMIFAYFFWLYLYMKPKENQSQGNKKSLQLSVREPSSNV